MQWNTLSNIDQLASIEAASFTKPQLILKHSTTCSISKMSLARLERSATPDNIDFHYLDLLNYRNISQAIAEKFKQQVQRYGTQIYILVPGPLLKAKWKDDLLFCTGNTYIKDNNNLFYINEEEKEKQRKSSIQNALQYYNIMSYNTFYKKVLGEKIIDKTIIENKNRSDAGMSVNAHALYLTEITYPTTIFC